MKARLWANSKTIEKLKNLPQVDNKDPLAQFYGISILLDESVSDRTLESDEDRDERSSIKPKNQ